MITEIIFYTAAVIIILLGVVLYFTYRKVRHWKRIAHNALLQDANIKDCDHKYQWVHHAKVKQCELCKVYDIVLPGGLNVTVTKMQ